MRRWLSLCRAKSIAFEALLGLALMALSAACARQPTAGHLYAVGETAEVDGWRVTVHSFSALATDQWHVPAEGQLFCAVELTLENNSGQIRFVMPEKQMMLFDGSGRVYVPDRNAAVMAARSRQWIVPEGELSIGERPYGAAAYQVPSGSQGMRWVFCSSLWPWARRVTFVLGDIPGFSQKPGM